MLPGTLKHIDQNAFSSCDNLRTVWAEAGCVDVRQLVSSSVDVQYEKAILAHSLADFLK